MRSNLSGIRKLYQSFSKKPFVTTAVILLISTTLGVVGCKKKQPGLETETGDPTLELFSEGYVSPVAVVPSPDDTRRLFVVDQIGKVWIVNVDRAISEQPFIDISKQIVRLNDQYDERGLLGLAFHPSFKNNGKFYLFYNAPARAGGPEPGVAWDNLTRISEFTVGADPNIVERSTEKIILEFDDPQMNHNGGTISFGPDGYLYISIGDGGGSNDVGPGHVEDWYDSNRGGNAQNIKANFLGKILRIDVNGATPYTIPSDNPFINENARPEIWAYGFRNPYRFSFDMGGSQEMYVGDAGQTLFEEINIVKKGGNYGWNIKEGFECFHADTNYIVRPECPSVDTLGRPILEPKLVFKNAGHPDGGGVGTAVVGGFIYRGSKVPALFGRYIFGVYSQSGEDLNGRVYAGYLGLGGYEPIAFRNSPDNLGQFLKGFGQDEQGEIYITTSQNTGFTGKTGKVYKMVAAPTN